MATPAEVQEILDGPALLAPPGATYQFENPPNINALCFSVVGVCIFGTLFAFCIRMYTKCVILRSLEAEDYSLVLAAVFFVASSVLVLEIFLAGAGTHQWNIQVKNIGKLLKGINTEEIVYCFAIVPAKVSIILQYLRIFTQVKKASFFYVGCWVLLWSTVLVYTISFWMSTFQCFPRDKTWDPLITTGHCLNSNAINIATGAFNVISDFLLVLLPQHEIWKLHMSPRKKLAVSAIFFIALCACVTSVFRLYWSVTLLKSGDGSYNVAFLGPWAVAEDAIAIICCCLPVFPRFFQVVGPKVLNLASRSLPFSNPAESRSGQSASIPKITHKLPDAMRGNKSDGVWASSENQSGTYETLNGGHELMDVGVRKGGDLSRGQGEEERGIRMVQTFEIESLPVEREDVDLERQGRNTSTRMGW